MNGNRRQKLRMLSRQFQDVIIRHVNRSEPFPQTTVVVLNLFVRKNHNSPQRRSSD